MKETDLWKGNDTYRYIRANPGCTVYDIADTLHVEDPYERNLFVEKLKQHTYRLFDNGKIERGIGNDGLSHFRVYEKEEQ